MTGISWKDLGRLLLRSLQTVYGDQRLVGTFAVVLALTVLFVSPLLRGLVNPRVALESSKLLVFQDSDAFRLDTLGLTRMTLLACEPMSVMGPVGSFETKAAAPGSNPQPGCDTPHTIVGATLMAGDYHIAASSWSSPPEVHLFSENWTWVSREFALIPRLEISVGVLLVLMLISIALVTFNHALFRY